MMKLSTITLSVATLTAAFALFCGTVAADSFNQNNIIDDTIFDNTGTMSAAQIDSWLNTTFGSTSCISTAHGFSAPDPTGYNPTQGFLYGGNVSAGQVIYDAAQAYGINPQVLLTTLQKEQSLVDGSAGCSTLRYAAAAGYGCPDGGTTYDYSGVDLYSINGVAVTSVSGTCVNTSLKVGFSQQVIRAAWLLKFGEQRSEGNINWAVIKGNWNNSDDPQSCYGGPMTQGTWQRCPSGSTTYYDGYTTIDGTAVHMDDGATAALYWYTPHFAGNQNFFGIFNNWFGSTFGMLVRSVSDPTYYVLTNGMRYGIPSGDILYAYNLQATPLRVVSDSYLASIPNGGILSTIFTRPNDGTVYLADGGKMYGIPSGSVCTAWGLACGDSSVQKGIGQDLVSRLTLGSTLGLMGQHNGSYFLMENGARRPFLTQQAITDAGYSASGAISVVNWTNLIRPSGYSFPQNNSMVQLGSGAIYLYSGSHFYGIPSMGVFKSWSLSNSVVSIDKSSLYNQQPPTTSGTLSSLVSYNSSYYLVDNGKRLDLTPLGPWPTAVDMTALSAYLQTIPLGTTINSSSTFRLPSGAIYLLQNSAKSPFYSVSDYFGLGYTQANLINLSDNNDLDSIGGGPTLLAEGSLFKKTGDQASIYLVGENKNIYTLTSLSQLGQFKLNTSNVQTVDSATYNQFTYKGSLTSGIIDDSGQAYILLQNGSRLSISPATLSAWGVDTSAWTHLSTTYQSRYTVSGNLSNFGQQAGGTIYYAQSGQKHPISSYNEFKQLGGTSTNTPLLPQDFLDSSPTGTVM